MNKIFKKREVIMSFTIKDILKMEVAPALGCTEPTAVALCAAVCAQIMDERNPDSIEIWVDPNIYKNGLAVSIPGTNGLAGNDMAAALGAVGGDPFLKLEVLQPIDEKTIKAASILIKEKKVKIHLLKDKKPIYIKAIVTKGNTYAEAIIEEVHNNIVSLKLNDKPIQSHPLLSSISSSQSNLQKLEAWLSSLKLSELITLLDQLDQDDMDFLEQGITCNMELAQYGLTYGPGLGVGLTMQRLVREGLLKKDMILMARILTSAAADARMGGIKLPAMSSGGSGNHGLTAILPIWAIKDFLVIDSKQQILRAIALSHMITAYVKAHTGRLSAVCGCSIAAGAGATGGITYLMGGTIHHIAGAIMNVLGDLAGVICDGAKAGCALKLATAAGTAVQSALFSLHGISIKGTDGIVANTAEETMKNIGELSTLGMIETDRTILDIMVKKQFANL
jgi:L-cysteine desulfidase